MTETLQIEGDLSRAQSVDHGRQTIARVRRALATGGRGMLAGSGGTKRFVVEMDDLMPTVICLSPLIARRIYTSGAQLTEEEIRAGLDQLRESNEDVALRQITETVDAIESGSEYARSMFDKALMDGDERALAKAWEMCRKVIGLRVRLDDLHKG